MYESYQVHWPDHHSVISLVIALLEAEIALRPSLQVIDDIRIEDELPLAVQYRYHTTGSNKKI